MARPNLANLRYHLPRPCRLAALCAVAILFFAGCTVGPNYVHPTAEVPADFKETPANWKQAQPSDAISKGKWWEIYQDPQLNELEEKINVSNQTLKAEQEQFAQARAALRITRSNLFPNVSTAPSVSRTHLAPNEPLFNAPTESKDYNTFTIPVDVSYEVDLWGRVRRSVESSRSEAQATGADLATISLSLHAELAGDYFQLRGLDTQKQLLDSNVQSFEKALALTESRYHGGLASAVDVAQAQTLLDTTRAEATDGGVQRASFAFQPAANSAPHAAADNSFRLAIGFARTPARYRRRGKARARTERADWRRPRRIFSAGHARRHGRLRKRGVHHVAAGPQRFLDAGRASGRNSVRWRRPPWCVRSSQGCVESVRR